MNHYGETAGFVELEAWGARLIKCAEDAPEDREILLALAKGSVNAILGYARKSRFEELEAWGAILIKCAENASRDREILLQLANGTVNAIGGYGGAGRFEELEAWGKQLVKCARDAPGDREFLLTLAKGSVNAIADYGEAARFEELETWGGTLARLGTQPPWMGELQERCHRGAFAATFFRGDAVDFERLLNALERAPWIQDPSRNDTPYLILVRDEMELFPNTPPTHFVSRVNELAERMLEANRRRAEVSENGASLADLKALWPERRFLPDWGRFLIVPLLEVGERSILDDVLTDPWITDEEREQYRLLAAASSATAAEAPDSAST